MSTLKIIGITIAAIIVMVIIVGAIGFYLLTRPSGMEVEMRPVEATTQDAQSFEQKIRILEEEIKAASAAGERKEVTITLTEEEVNAKIDDVIDEIMAETGEELTINMGGDALVNFDADRIRVLAKVNVLGITVNAGVEAQVTVENGKVNLEIEDIDIGKLPFMGSVGDRIRSELTEEESDIDFDDLLVDLEEGLPVELQDISIENGKIIITGVTR